MVKKLGDVQTDRACDAHCKSLSVMADEVSLETREMLWQGGYYVLNVCTYLNNKSPGRACSGALAVRLLCPAFDVSACLLGNLTHT